MPLFLSLQYVVLFYILVLVLEYPTVKLSGLYEILPPKSFDVKNFIQNTTKMVQLRMPFLLSIKWYQVFPPLLIHCAPYSNCMCHAGDSAYQGLNVMFWNLNRFIIQQNDRNKHDNNVPMNQLLTYIFKLFFILIFMLLPGELQLLQTILRPWYNRYM